MVVLKVAMELATPPGTKVYCFPAIWGDGYEKIMVIARHRGARDFVKMVIRSDWITNWRAKVAYHQSILTMFQEESANWKSKEHVETYLLGLNRPDCSNCNLQAPY